MDAEIEAYLKFRHKTRFLRKYAGLVIAVIGLGITGAVLLINKLQDKGSAPPSESALNQQIKPLQDAAKTTAAAPAIGNSTTAEAETETEEDASARKISPETTQAMQQWADASKALHSFFSAKTLEGRIPWLIQTKDQPSASRFAAYHQRSETLPWLSLPETLGPKFVLRDSFLITSVTFAQSKPRPIVLEKTANGWQVDWESYVGYSEKTLRELVASSTSDEPVLVRAEAYRVHPSPPGFPTRDYLALMLRHPDEGVALQAVAQRKTLETTPAGRALLAHLPGRFTLKVKPSVEGQNQGWAEVTEVVCPGWVPRLYDPASEISPPAVTSASTPANNAAAP